MNPTNAMFSRFSDQTRIIFGLAQCEAEALGHDCIGSEHLLLALIKQRDFPVANVFASLGITGELVKCEIKKLVTIASQETARGCLPFNKQSQSVLLIASTEALSSAHDDIRIEDLAIGILELEDCIAAKALIKLGLELEEVRGLLRNSPGADESPVRRKSLHATPDAVPICRDDDNRCDPAVLVVPSPELHFLFDKFTERARKIIALAQSEAERLRHGTVDSGHIMLGLARDGMRDGGGVAIAALIELAIDVKDARSEDERLMGTPLVLPAAETPQFTAQAIQVLAHARAEAAALGHPSIGTEHLLLGMIREQDGIVAQALGKLGCTNDDVRAMIRSLLGYHLS